MWHRIIETLYRIGAQEYVQKIVASYFTDSVLRYDTEKDPKEYSVIGGVP